MASPIAIVQVYDTAISGLFDHAGDAGRYAARGADLTYAFAVADAPVRSGDLKTQHRKGGALKRGPYRIEATVRNDSAHAAWVHDGTEGPIRARGGKVLRLPAAPHSPVMIYKPSVRGQKANPWLFRAGQRAARILGGEARRTV